MNLTVIYQPDNPYSSRYVICVGGDPDAALLNDGSPCAFGIAAHAYAFAQGYAHGANTHGSSSLVRTSA